MIYKIMPRGGGGQKTSSTPIMSPVSFMSSTVQQTPYHHHHAPCDHMPYCARAYLPHVRSVCRLLQPHGLCAHTFIKASDEDFVWGLQMPPPAPPVISMPGPVPSMAPPIRTVSCLCHPRQENVGCCSACILMLCIAGCVRHQVNT